MLADIQVITHPYAHCSNIMMVLSWHRAYLGLVSLWQGRDEVMCIGDASSRLHLRSRTASKHRATR
jgi:hypothetical protein